MSRIYSKRALIGCELSLHGRRLTQLFCCACSRLLLFAAEKLNQGSSYICEKWRYQTFSQPRSGG